MSQLRSYYSFEDESSYYTNSVDQRGERSVFQEDSAVEKSISKVVNRHKLPIRKKRVLMQLSEFIHDDSDCWHLNTGEDFNEIHERCSCSKRMSCFCDICCLELQ